MELLNITSLWIGVIGIIVMVWGVLLVILEFLRLEYTTLKKKQIELTQHSRNNLRRHLGSYILLGLEFMIAGDIIHTILRPNQEALIVLGSIVAIRTVISYFLHKELSA